MDQLTDSESDVGLLADTAGHGKGGSQAGKGARLKAAWQRVDERKDAELLRAQLQDWEDWDPSRPDEVRGPGAAD